MKFSKKTLPTIIVSAGIIFNSIYLVNASEKDNSNLLITAYNKMEKAVFTTQEYGWEAIMKAERPILNAGVLSGKIDDFDNDGESELLVLKITDSTSSPEDYVEAYMEMYEVINENVILSDSTDHFTFIDMRTDSGGLECFTKEPYIVLECATQNYTFADGTSQNINIYEYKNNNFTLSLNWKFSGSTIGPEEAYEYYQKFKSLNFNGTANYLYNGEVSAATPTFSDKESLNLAVLESNIDRIYEIYIKNNVDKLYDDYDINSYFDEWHAILVDKAKMGISVNNFSVIKAPEIKVILNGKELSFDQQPYIKNGTTMVPMRVIFEALGATVDYDAATKTITAHKGNTVIEIVTDSTVAKVNGKTSNLPVAVANKNGSTMIPLRFVSEALGANVNWDSSAKTVTISTVS